MELNHQEKEIIKDFIQALALEWKLTPLQVVKKVIRHWNVDSIAVTKLLYSCVKGEE